MRAGYKPSNVTRVEDESLRDPEEELGLALFAQFNGTMTYPQLIKATGISQSTLRRLFREDKQTRPLRYIDYAKVANALGVSLRDVLLAIDQSPRGDAAEGGPGE